MERRQFVTLTSAVAASLTSGLVFAADKKSQAKPVESKNAQLALVALECAQIGEQCVAFCTNELAKGDTMMAKCLSTSQNMIATCQALARAALHDQTKPASLKTLATACAAFCRDCMEECKKHVNHHEICKKCFEHCERCAKACEAA